MFTRKSFQRFAPMTKNYSHVLYLRTPGSEGPRCADITDTSSVMSAMSNLDLSPWLVKVRIKSCHTNVKIRGNFVAPHESLCHLHMNAPHGWPENISDHKEPTNTDIRVGHWFADITDYVKISDVRTSWSNPDVRIYKFRKSCLQLIPGIFNSRTKH